MRFQDLRGLKKHLSSAASDHLAGIYYIVIGDESERHLFAEKTRAFLLKEVAESEVVSLSKERHTLADLIRECEESSLFSQAKLIFFEGAEALGSDFTKLKLTKGNHIFLFSQTMQKALFTFAEKEGIVLDLSKEKPWDRKERIIQETFHLFSRASKQISKEVLTTFCERVGEDPSLIQMEVEKLIAYVAERTQITQDDLNAITIWSEKQNDFKLAEAIVWQKSITPRAFNDTSDFLQFLGLIRYHLYVGLKLIQSKVQGRDPELPKYRPNKIEAMSKEALALGEKYFLEKLQLVFATEFEAKQSTQNAQSLFDRLHIGFCHGHLSPT